MHPPTMAAAVVPRPPWCLTPGSAAHDNQPTFWATVVCGGAGSGTPWRPLSAIYVTTCRRTLWGVVGCVLRRNRQGSIPDNQRCLPNEVRESIPVGIGAVGSAASMPNGSLCRVHRFGTSRGNDALRRWCQRRRNRGRRRLFPQHVNSRIDR